MRPRCEVESTTPLIFITAYSDDKLRTKALDGGEIDYLLKPLGDEAAPHTDTKV